MRIHNLELNAYGPFAGTVCLDFDELNAEGLFLLNGPTGSGKSSILDAICYALYGSTSSGRTDLKSRFAAPEAEPWVKMECSVAGKRYRIFRSPEYQRPKKRGTGTTREQAKVTIEVFDAKTGQWEADASVTRHKDAGDFMYSVIGLTAAQFNQVMLLPQGKFQQFLVAKSSEREELLKKLFATGDFERIQAALETKAKAAEQQAGSAQMAMTALVERAHRAETAAELAEARTALGQPADENADEFSWAGSSPAAAQERVDALAQTTGDLATCTERRLASASAQLADLRASHHQLSELSRNWEQFFTLKEHHTNLQTQRAEVEAAEAQLALDRRAAGVLTHITAATRAETAHRDAAKRLEHARQKAQAAAEQALTGLNESASEYAVLLTAHALNKETDVSQLIEELETQQVELTQLARTDSQLKTLLEAQETARGRTADLEKALETAKTASQQHREYLVDLNQQYQALEEAGSQLTLARLAAEKADRAAQQAQELEVARTHRARAEKEAARTEENRKAAAKRAETLQEQRFAQAAQTLAETLVEGQPCAVCGATEHPAPATTLADLPTVTSHEVKEAQSQRSQAEEAAQRALLTLTAARTRCEQLTTAGTLPLNQAEQLVAQAQEDLKASQERVDVRTHLAEQIADAQQQTNQLTGTEQSAATALTQHTAQLEQRQQHITAYQAELADQEQNSSFAHRAAALTDLTRALGAIGAVQAEHQRLTSATALAAQDLNQALLTSGFASGAEAQAAALPAHAQKALTHRVTTFREAELTLAGQLATEAMQQVAALHAQGQKPPGAQELEELAHSIQSHEQNRDALLRLNTRLSAATHELTSISTELATSRARSEKLLVQAQLARELAATAIAAKGSDNALRMTLTTYVLAAQLEEVALAASEHLVAMTHGRYSLRHTDEAEGRGSKSGLGLEVYDAWHSAARHPSSLSGGESFMASLSLALGLADVVQQSNGGIEIDTLFVDEGFGSLDEQTLEEVMSTIDTLREGGRVIGLISHVAEMKNRISKHVLLGTSPTGSKLLTETGAL